ncbi:peroxidase [Trifolium repens]|nr:peroxidase [Trifolium repens]
MVKNKRTTWIPKATLVSVSQHKIDQHRKEGLDIEDLVVLSGSHTIGRARCVSFKQRIYDTKQEYYHGYEYDHYKRYTNFRRILRFDNHYFINFLEGKGLLGSDNVLIGEDLHGIIREQVWGYASNEKLFFDSFAKSMIKMGNINVLTGDEGEIRRNCRFVNP